MSYFVYILKCSDQTLYIGSTNNIQKRFVAHNSKKSGAKYTRGRRPVALVYFKKYKTRTLALRQEHIFKKLTRTEKLHMIDAAQ